MEAVDKIAIGRCIATRICCRSDGAILRLSGADEALATGAERVYLPEEGVTSDLEKDVRALQTGFRKGKRLGLIIPQ